MKYNSYMESKFENTVQEVNDRKKLFFVQLIRQ